MAKDRVTVQEAARRLGVKDDAIRKRIQRGTLQHDKDQDGRVYVYMDATHDASEDGCKDSTRYSSHPTAEDASYVAAEQLVDALRDQVEHLRSVIETRDKELESRTEEIRRRDHIIAALTKRIPELEAPAKASSEPRDSRETASNVREGVEEREPIVKAQKGAVRPSWWRRLFNG